jgi:hypothetical protein
VLDNSARENATRSVHGYKLDVDEAISIQHIYLRARKHAATNQGLALKQGCG